MFSRPPAVRTRILCACAPPAALPRKPLLSLRQAQYALANDIALDLARPRANDHAARREHPVRPLALVDGEGSLVEHLAIRSEQFHRELLHPQIEFAECDLLNRALRPRRQSFELTCQLSQCGV